jgi:transcriptional regulator with XRE-family HTH domain|tara:strand:- start:158 stop:361 length:204 start_codon:yes stop_codon:yes gene_type:complete
MKYNRIKDVLVEKQVSQKSLSNTIGVSTVSVNQWCQNKKQPSIKMLYQISEILNCKSSELIIDKLEL